MRIKKTILILLILFPLFLVFSNVWAEYKLEVGIPGQIDKGEEVGLADYVRSIYLFALGAIGVVALGALVFGGLTYMLSDTLTSKEEAKKWIWGAIGGLVLGFSSYLILNTINPDLVRINPPSLELELPQAPNLPGNGGAEYEWVAVPINKYCKDVLGDEWVNVNGNFCSGSSPGTGYSCCGKFPTE